MKTLPTRITNFAIGAAIALPLAAAGASAYAQQAPTNGWYKVCSKQEENDICNVQFQSVAATGQLLTAVSLLEVKGKINGRKFQVTVPSGRLVPPGIKVKIDENAPVTLPYAVCFPQRCIAEAQLDDNVIASLKNGGELTLTSTNFQSKENPIKVTLEGFTAAYEGEPLKQDELEARQRQLQDELRKKAEEQRQRLQAEQEKAKQGATN